MSMNQDKKNISDTQHEYTFLSDELDLVLQCFPMGLVAFDLETTGLSPLIDRIIEIGAIKIGPDRKSSFFQTLVRPQIKIPPHTTAIHGITNDMVRDAPLIGPALASFESFCSGLPLVAHNAKFDIGFLAFSAHKSNSPIEEHEIYCSCHFSRKILKEMPNHRLATLSRELNISLENHHRAGDDAMASMRIYIKCLERLKKSNKLPLFSTSLLCHSSQFRKEVELEISPHLLPLVEKAQAQEVVGIIYKGGSMKNQLRPIRPVSLLPMPGGNILYALCMVSNTYKSFALNKIVKVEELTEDIEWIIKKLNQVKKISV